MAVTVINEPKVERTIYKVVGTASGTRIMLTTPTWQAFKKATILASALESVPGLQEESKAVKAAIVKLLEKATSTLP
jgi:hypothetical protein